MTQYTEFVKLRMAELKSTDMKATEKMSLIAKEWRSSKGKIVMGKTSKKSVKSVKREKGVKNVVYLENGVPLHPDMMGAGFFSGSFGDVMRDIWTGFKMPFEFIGKVAESPLGKVAMKVVPMVL